MSEQKKSIRVRIVNDGQPSHMTKITDAETGASIEMVKEVHFTYDAADRDAPVAQLVVYAPVVDVIVDAEIRHVCPYCGRAIEEEPG